MTDAAPSEDTKNSVEAESEEVAAAPAEDTTVTKNEFDSPLDEFLNYYLDTPSSELDDHRIRKFESEIPKDYVVPDDRFKNVFKVLSKMKNVPNKAVVNDSKSALEKLCQNVDFNKFLCQYWSTEFPLCKNGPIGATLNDGKHRFDFSNVAAAHNKDADYIEAKVKEVGWSLVLDIDATITEMLKLHMNDQPVSVLCLIILRRFKCLGDFKIKIDGKEVPIFIYFFRRLLNNVLSSGNHNKVVMALSCIISVCCTRKTGNKRWPLMAPSYALCEIMNSWNDDQEHAFLEGVRRLLTPMQGFDCNIRWDPKSKDYDNQALFLFKILTYYNRKQSFETNQQVFYIIQKLRDSVRYFGHKFNDFDAVQAPINIDWPFAFHVFEYLKTENFKLPIPATIYSTIAEVDAFNYQPLSDGEPSFEKAIIALMELYFVGEKSDPGKAGHPFLTPDVFYINLWNNLPHPESLIETFAQGIFKSYQNLKKSLNIQTDLKFADHVTKIVNYCMDQNALNDTSSVLELKIDEIVPGLALIIIARVIRLFLKDSFDLNHRRPVLQDLDPFVNQLLKSLCIKTRDRFNVIRNQTENLWAPWRQGTAPCMTDDKSMAINHFLNAIQKEAFCIWDLSFGENPFLTDFLEFLLKKRRFFGLVYPRLEDSLRSRHRRAAAGAREGGGNAGGPGGDRERKLSE